MKNKYQNYIIFCLFWILSTSETVSFSHLTIKDGLSQSTIKCIFQDSKGFLWFGTSDGLNKFDGYDFTIFNNNPNDPKSICGNDVSCIYENTNDSVLWIGTQDGGLNYYDRKQNRFVAFKAVLNNLQNWSLKDIRNLTSSKDNKLWISTYGEGFFSFSFTDSLLKQPEFCKLPNFRNINDLEIDDASNIWIASTTGLFYWSLENQIKKTAPEKIELLPNIKQINVRSIKFDFKGNLWVGTIGRGLFKYHPVSKELANYTFSVSPNSLPSNTIRTIFQTRNSTIWIGTTNGLCKYLPKTDNFEVFKHNSSNPNSLNSNGIYSMLEDRSGILWIGTYLGGANILDPMQTKFPKFNNIFQDNTNHIIHNNTGSIYKDDQKRIWIGTSEGLIETNEAILNSNIREGKLHLKGKFINALFFYRQSGLFVSTLEGIYLKEKKQQKFVYITPVILKQTGASILRFNSAIIDNKKDIWLACPGGLLKYSFAKKEFRLIKSKGPDGAEMEINSSSIIEDFTGKIWLGTFDGKLFSFDKHTEIFERELISGNSNPIFFSKIFSICESTPGNIWIGSNRGLYNLNSKTGETHSFLDVDGLSNNIVYAVVSDNAGKIWCSTNKGVSCYDPKTKSFQNFTYKDGLQSNEFNQGAYFKDPEGILYMGGIDGINIFNPEEIKLNSFLPPVVITKMQLQYNTITPESNPEILNNDISESKSIQLNYKQNTFGFEFTALSFSLPERNQYQYSLSIKGEPENWVTAGNRRFATFTNVPPGNYIFKVKGSNSDGLWNESPTSVEIKIKPPFWSTMYFRSLLLLLVIGLSYLIIYFRIRSIHNQKRILKKLVKQKTEALERQTEHIEVQNKKLININKKIVSKNKNIERINQQLNDQHTQILKQRDNLLHMAEKVEEANQTKLRFFTGISHEFKTPLTLIINPLRDTLKNIDNWERKVIAHKLNNVYSNAAKLLLMVNQLMDFRKVETENMKMLVSKFELVSFVQKNAFLFNDWAARKKIQFSFSSSTAKIELWADKDKLEKIIYNLLSNAFKFTPNNGLIDLKILSIKRDNEEYIELRFIDNGTGIEKDKTEQIFDRFFQLEKPSLNQTGGSGLGLALVKKYVELHKGTISVNSEPNKGSEFIVQLPTGKKHFDKNVRFDESGGEDKEILRASIGEYVPITREENSGENREKQTLLIVEDDNSLRSYLKDILWAQFNIEEAENAKLGFSLAETKNPDLVICDVMLTDSNGFELCKKLKSEFQTCHLPVILLTSLADKNNQMLGIKAGADDYITKPFDLQHLILSIDNLIEGRLRLQKKYNLSNPDDIETVVPNSKDQQFLIKAVKLIEANLTNTSFNVELFCVQMQYSQPQCYRKIKAITGFNISEFIRNTRLKKASQLLKSGELKINEVAYETGFNDPNYFTKSFTKLFGMTPSDYAKL